MLKQAAVGVVSMQTHLIKASIDPAMLGVADLISPAWKTHGQQHSQ